MSTPDQPTDPARDPYAGQPSPYDQGYGTSGSGQPSPYDQPYGTSAGQPSADGSGYSGYGATPPSPYDQGYGAAPGYGQPPAADPYGQAPYGQPDAYGQAPAYGQSPVYGQTPDYGQPSAYGQVPAYGQPPAYGQAPAYGQHPAFGPQGAYPGAPAAWGAAPYVPAYGYPKNSLGVWSLVLGLLGFFLCGAFTGVAAIITGVLSRQAVARGEANNGGMALAGIIIGSLGTAWGLLVFFAAFVPELSGSGSYGY